MYFRLVESQSTGAIDAPYSTHIYACLFSPQVFTGQDSFEYNLSVRIISTLEVRRAASKNKMRSSCNGELNYKDLDIKFLNNLNANIVLVETELKLLFLHSSWL